MAYIINIFLMWIIGFLCWLIMKLLEPENSLPYLLWEITVCFLFTLYVLTCVSGL